MRTGDPAPGARQTSAPVSSGRPAASEIVGERGERVVPLGRRGMGSVSLRAKQSDAHEVPYDRYGIGLHHLAFRAASREAVDERTAWRRGQGAESSRARAYHAVFFRDPDGLKLEVLHRPAA